MTTLLRHHPRIAVVGTSCSGKTTLAGSLATLLGRDHIELDALYWGPNWTPRADFADRALAAIAADEWVVDGNYRIVRERLLARATAVVWLDYRLAFVFARAMKRTVKRLVSRTTLFSGNRESFRQAFFHRDGIPWWVLRTHRRRRREYPLLFADPRFAHLEVYVLTAHEQAVALLEREAAELPRAAVS